VALCCRPSTWRWASPATATEEPPPPPPREPTNAPKKPPALLWEAPATAVACAAAEAVLALLVLRLNPPERRAMWPLPPMVPEGDAEGPTRVFCGPSGSAAAAMTWLLGSACPGW
jgi:hypothetical protein